MPAHTFIIQRFNPATDAAAHMHTMPLPDAEGDAPPPRTVLDALLTLRRRDATLTFRCSSRDGACGADAISINGHSALASQTLLRHLPAAVVLRPLPGLRVLRDLAVDLTPFFRRIAAVQPWLRPAAAPPPVHARAQSQARRAALEPLLGCTLCACCAAECPSVLRNTSSFPGPAAALHALRFIADSRDAAATTRLNRLDAPQRLFLCRSAANCTAACPAGLSPARAIARLRQMLARRVL